MQKLDFVKALETITNKLMSQQIVKVFAGGFSQPSNQYSYNSITPLLFLSKSNYDQLKDNDKYLDVLKSLDAQNIYTEGNLSMLTKVLQQVQAHQIIQNPNAIAFYNFHNTLLATLKLSREILIKDLLFADFEEALNNGIVVFQILIDKEGLETEKYIKIFSELQELIETISKIENEQEQQSEVILLDSGSDTNLAIKTGIATAKSLFLIFKEVWNYVINFRHYKQKQQNNALLESLSIRAQIKKMVEEGVLSEKEGLEYSHMVKTRTDTLIGMKVLPKQIVTETNQIENRKLLSEFEGFKMLVDTNENNRT